MSIRATKQCYALCWSYGEICVHCNCCGRYGDNGINHARLNYWKYQLEESLTFDNWITPDDSPDWQDWQNDQKQNVLINISLSRKKIQFYESEIYRAVVRQGIAALLTGQIRT